MFCFHRISSSRLVGGIWTAKWSQRCMYSASSIISWSSWRCSNWSRNRCYWWDCLPHWIGLCYGIHSASALESWNSPRVGPIAGRALFPLKKSLLIGAWSPRLRRCRLRFPWRIYRGEGALRCCCIQRSTQSFCWGLFSQIYVIWGSCSAFWRGLSRR